MKAFLVVISFSAVCTIVSILRTYSSQGLTLVFCDVGQGDAILIQQGVTQVLVDGGQGKEVLSCLGEYMPWFDRQIELVVATHPDSDHIGGLSWVISAYKVNKLLQTDDTKATTVFNDLERLVQAEKARGLEEIRPVDGQTFALSSTAKLSTIYMNSENMLQDANNKSIVFSLDCGGVKALLMADIEKKAEQALIDLGMLTDVTILKIGHHGSKSSTSNELLQVTQPEISVISVGKLNKYGHPSPDVLSRLLDHGSKVLRTDRVGDVVFTCRSDQFVQSVRSK